MKLIVIWYLVLTTQNGGITTIPQPYRTKVECQASAQEFYKDRAEQKGPFGYGTCVSATKEM